ncbi:MAG: sodium-dependent transporter [Coriobacteriia bacterium]|nr:sodium-dependent transporter [Coriobacteriia bacterium]
MANEQITENAPRATWTSKWTFVIAAAASAVGLGNFWRFPYLAAKFGGGTFLIMYAIFVFTVGISLLLLETSLGRNTGLSVVGAFARINKKSKWLGYLAAAVPFVIGPYYFVVGGWVCKYVAAYISTSPEILANGSNYFNAFQHSELSSYVWLGVFMGLTFLVVAFGVNGGIERGNMIMMPTLIVVAIAIAIYISVQPGSSEGIKYYFVPDWSVMSPELIINALSQTFYTLSLAMGIMVTYGSYLKRREPLTKSVCQIGGFSFGVSLIAGAIIVPAAFMAFGTAPTSAGPSLMFITLPQVFLSMGPVATSMGILFFVLVLFAALTSSISVVETCVSIFVDNFHMRRSKSIIILLIYMVLFAAFVNSGYNFLSTGRIFGMEFLDFFDFVTNSIMMPIVALATCIVVGWVVKPNLLIVEIELSGYFRFKTIWTIMIKYVCPILITLILISNVATALGD